MRVSGVCNKCYKPKVVTVTPEEAARFAVHAVAGASIMGRCDDCADKPNGSGKLISPPKPVDGGE